MTPMRAWPSHDLSSREAKRDATAGELQGEPDAALQDMANGLLGVTLTTALLAKAELDYRRLRGR